MTSLIFIIQFDLLWIISQTKGGCFDKCLYETHTRSLISFINLPHGFDIAIPLIVQI